MPETSQQSATTQEGSPGLAKLVNNPFFGFLPFIIVSLLAAPGRYVLAIALAFAASVILTIAGSVANRLPPGQLDWAGLILFGVLLVLGLFHEASESWLEHNTVLLSDAVVLVVAVGGILVRRPFTLRYAKLQPEFRARWDADVPGFRAAAMRTTNIISLVWGACFLIQLICQAIVEFGPDEDHNNWLLVWGLPVASIIGAIKFTQYFAEQARARGEAARAEATRRTDAG